MLSLLSLLLVVVLVTGLLLTAAAVLRLLPTSSRPATSAMTAGAAGTTRAVAGLCVAVAVAVVGIAAAVAGGSRVGAVCAACIVACRGRGLSGAAVACIGVSTAVLAATVRVTTTATASPLLLALGIVLGLWRLEPELALKRLEFGLVPQHGLCCGRWRCCRGHGNTAVVLRPSCVSVDL